MMTRKSQEWTTENCLRSAQVTDSNTHHTFVCVSTYMPLNSIINQLLLSNEQVISQHWGTNTEHSRSHQEVILMQGVCQASYPHHQHWAQDLAPPYLQPLGTANVKDWKQGLVFWSYITVVFFIIINTNQHESFNKSATKLSLFIIISIDIH